MGHIVGWCNHYVDGLGRSFVSVCDQALNCKDHLRERWDKNRDHKTIDYDDGTTK